MSEKAASVCRRGLVLLALHSLLTCLFIGEALAFECSSGADVRDASFCRFFYHYTKDYVPPDPRISSRLGLKHDEQTRSFAFIVGISKYPHLPGNDLLPAANDVRKLETFLKDKQKFDEIIVLENDDATETNISYFLDRYLLARSSLYGGKGRLLFAYTGHGIGETNVLPASLLLAQATSISDVDHLYSLAQIRTSLENLAKANFHVVTFINACFGGSVFSNALAGGNPADSYRSGSYGVTAGAADQLVYSLGKPGDGSIFFDTIIKGISTGDADPNYPTIVLPTRVERGGVVRLGQLNGYLTAEIERLNRISTPIARAHYFAPWIGAIEPAGHRAFGGFFFISPVKQNIMTGGNFIVPYKGNIPSAVSTLAFSGPASSVRGRPDIKIFNAPTEYPIRGIDISHYNGKVDWNLVRSEVKFVYIRATGKRPDPQFESYWAGSAKAGLARGAYHVFSFCDSADAQFGLIAKVVPKTPDALPLAIDVEWYGKGASMTTSPEDRCSKLKSADEIRNSLFALAELVRKHYGKVPLIYGSRQAFADLMNERFSRFMVWFATYVRGAPGSPPDIKLPGRNPWTLWQYKEDGQISGIQGKVDLNAFFGTPAQFEQFKQGRENLALAAVTAPPP